MHRPKMSSQGHVNPDRKIVIGGRILIVFTYTSAFCNNISKHFGEISYDRTSLSFVPCYHFINQSLYLFIINCHNNRF